MYLGKLDFEDVNLVEEQDDRRAKEPSRINDRLEQEQRLCHSILCKGRLRKQK